MTEVLDKARAWLAEDPDRHALRADRTHRARGICRRGGHRRPRGPVLGQAGVRLPGLRGTLGAGSNRMNRAVVIRAAAGLAAYLRAAGRASSSGTTHDTSPTSSPVTPAR